ncbi:hypothetical protein [Dendronalium sp. ChiSLP03b]|uniref:hypothetical protein n=1 Tax=Dendronalium sp. ChiSLP03b TaxID=3075381 RepID=UPI003919FB7F
MSVLPHIEDRMYAIFQFVLRVIHKLSQLPHAIHVVIFPVVVVAIAKFTKIPSGYYTFAKSQLAAITS